MANRKFYSSGVLTYEDVNDALDDIIFEIIESYDSNEYDTVGWGMYHHYWNGGYYLADDLQEAKYILNSIVEYLEDHIDEDPRGISRFIDTIEGLLFAL